MKRNLKYILKNGVSKISMTIQVTNLVEFRKRELKQQLLNLKK